MGGGAGFVRCELKAPGHTHGGARRDKGRWESPDNDRSGADPGPPCGHQPTKDTSLQAYRSSGAPQWAGTQGKD